MGIRKIAVRSCRRFLTGQGYAVSGRPGSISDGYVLAAQDQTYEQYVAKQTEGNHRKIDKVWADEATIGSICDYLLKTGDPLRSGLCHGSRNAAEVRWFNDRLGVPVIGTDISDTAPRFGLTQWDFHKENPDWVGKFDFVYTNSHDHARDPQKAFDTWVGQLSPTGRLFIEHTDGHGLNGVSELDPFGVPPREMPYVTLRFGRGRYAVTDMIVPSHKKNGKLPIWVFVVRAL